MCVQPAMHTACCMQHDMLSQLNLCCWNTYGDQILNCKLKHFVIKIYLKEGFYLKELLNNFL